MADGGDGFDGCIEVVQRTRGYRRWPNDVKARIVAESFQPGVRVVDVARRHGLAAHQLRIGGVRRARGTWSCRRLRQRHGYKTPDQIRAEQKALEPVAATEVKMAA